MSEALGFAEELIWGLVCPKCGKDRNIADLGYESVKVGQKIYHECDCGCKIVKIVGKDMGKEAVPNGT